jgi:transcriptional regulator with GAF, ATPase, and Fis domain
LLVWHFIVGKQARVGKTMKNIPQRVMKALVQYDWPGNVRELENVIERAMILSPGSILVLPESFGEVRRRGPSDDSPRKLEDIDRAHIVGVLKDCNWRVKGADNAAERLGLKPSTLRYRMKKLGIRRP